MDTSSEQEISIEQQQKIDSIVRQLYEKIDPNKPLSENVPTINSHSNALQQERFFRAQAHSEKRKDYHDKEGVHPQKVEKRARELATLLDASERTQNLIALTAGLHDITESENECAQIYRNLLLKWNNEKDGNFSQEEIQNGYDAILATQVKMEPSKSNNGNEYTTAKHVYVKQPDTIYSFCLRNADVMTAWVGKPTEFLQEGIDLGNEIFRFDNEAINRQMVTKWFRDIQPAFAQGRMLETARDIKSASWLPQEHKQQLLMTYPPTGFTENAQYARLKGWWIAQLCNATDTTDDQIRAAINVTDPDTLQKKVDDYRNQNTTN